MNNRAELIDALLTFSRQAEKLANLLATELTAAISIEDNQPIATIPTSERTINVAQYQMWPEASCHPPDIKYRAHLDTINLGDLSDQRILEYAIDIIHPISVFHKHANVDLICNQFWEGQAQLRLLNSFKETHDQYDIGILWEVLEFCDNPLMVLMEMKKRCKKIIIRFRPWTGREGAFQSHTINKAFIHLLMPIEQRVKFVVIRPLATYDKLLATAKLTIQSRHINSLYVESFIQEDKEIINTIIERTWGKIGLEDAIRIMMTDSVDYLVY